MNRIMMKYSKENWSVDIPDGWVVEEDDECVTLFNPEGVGAFQISSYFKEDGHVTNQDLLEISEAKTPIRLDLPNLQGIHEQRSEDGSTFFYWWFALDSHFIFATYNCESGKEEVESIERDKIIHSFRFPCCSE